MRPKGRRSAVDNDGREHGVGFVEDGRNVEGCDGKGRKGSRMRKQELTRTLTKEGLVRVGRREL